MDTIFPVYHSGRGNIKCCLNCLVEIMSNIIKIQSFQLCHQVFSIDSFSVERIQETANGQFNKIFRM